MDEARAASIMARAARLARRGWYSARPNPRVGCVLVRDGEVVGEGWHRRAGEPHAEVLALRAAGARARGATACVTLEPCDHQGRTPPCSRALIEAGIARVIYGVRDPHARAAGGLRTLAAAGIEVRGPVLEAECRALNPGFLLCHERGWPRVRLKVAASLDGRTAMASGESRWITGAAARRDVQCLRAESCAIVTGIGTLLADDPRLTVRREELDLAADCAPPDAQPLRVVVDSALRVRGDLRLFAEPGQVLIATAAAPRAVAGAEVIALPDAEGRVDLAALLRHLGERQCHEVLVEAGARLAGALLAQGLVDQLILYLAPKLLGSEGWPLASLPLHRLAEAIELDIVDLRAVGADWRLIAEPRRRA
ncbi:MAG: bifunctional diaminohydroxyphosphoribosylaminopyrimidine deaminase/5-amino-6-(5-phosphoribosylamino)uracil reductase RibD [Pseudomonadota bacterium]